MRRIALLLALLGLLTACDDKPKPRPESASAATAMPADPALAQVYDTSCKLCHANPASGAPLTGDRSAWSPRVAQGADTLLDHSINGYNGMPPMGLCMQCSEEQFLALISFMSGTQIQQ
ncbi:cytochrome c5 family protein [Pseudomonas sp. P7548]|uniref:c-type cytochrome n=1 Tax=Pseudomonas sp. P7548 TaxID=2726981 RepID=UPI0015B86923|nr:cytochrome c5 family protein [Pseudomonas sp. P7548]NWE18163.1 cytochrome c5 family protein [Pseudomonas sp. P7548]